MVFKKEWRAKYLNHEIAVDNGWSMGVKFNVSGYAKLYIDGGRVDENKDVTSSPYTPSLRGKITEGTKIHIVEVYLKSGLFKVMAKICVDGKKIAGDF